MFRVSVAEACPRAFWTATTEHPDEMSERGAALVVLDEARGILLQSIYHDQSRRDSATRLADNPNGRCRH